jgi:ABC-2 type transport system ATP-binding protein
VIEIVGVTKSFGARDAVDNLTMTVRPGEIYALLGHNGAGKTTTIKMVSGLLRPTRGTIRVCGLDIATQGQEARRLLGYIPDEPYLYEKLSGREFLEFVGRVYGVDGRPDSPEISRLVDLFGMGAYIDELIESYSHGMRQRVVLSATLLHKPSAMVVDEPLVGLDPQSIRLVRRIFEEEAKGGASILLSTHVLSIAESLATRIGILSYGKLVAEGTLEELKARSRDSRDLEEIFFKVLGEETA